MWEFLGSHPWWGLVYLLITCLTMSFVTMGIGAALGARRRSFYEEYLARQAKSDSDGVVH